MEARRTPQPDFHVPAVRLVPPVTAARVCNCETASADLRAGKIRCDGCGAWLTYRTHEHPAVDNRADSARIEFQVTPHELRALIRGLQFAEAALAPVRAGLSAPRGEMLLELVHSRLIALAEREGVGL